MTKNRLILAGIDKRIVCLCDVVEQQIDYDYEWISKQCEEAGQEPSEYFKYYADEIQKYLLPSNAQGSNNQGSEA